MIRFKRSKTGVLQEIYAHARIRRIFRSAVGTYILDFKNFRREFESALERSKVKKFTLRDLRKSGLSKLYEKTKDIKLCQLAAGHKSPRTTDWYIVKPQTEMIKAGKAVANAYVG